MQAALQSFSACGCIFFLCFILYAKAYLKGSINSREKVGGIGWVQLRNESTYLVLFLLTFLYLISILLLGFLCVFLHFPTSIVWPRDFPKQTDMESQMAETEFKYLSSWKNKEVSPGKLLSLE